MNRFNLNVNIEKLVKSLEKDKSLKKQAMIVQSIFLDYINVHATFAHYMNANLYVEALKGNLKMLFRKMDNSNDPEENSTYPSYCFSTRVDNNTIWQIYTKDFSGIMHTLSIDDIDKISNEHPVIFGPILYIDEVGSLLEILRNIESAYNVNKLVEIFLNFCKTKQWELEKEYRLIYLTEEDTMSIEHESLNSLTLLNVEKKRERDVISNNKIKGRRG